METSYNDDVRFLKIKGVCNTEYSINVYRVVAEHFKRNDQLYIASSLKSYKDIYICILYRSQTFDK